MLSYIFYFFLAYLAYQLVFKFILPIYRTTRQNQAGQPFSKAQPQKQEPVGDYIDFEEVKEK
jgi:hypothetical protein